MGLIAVNSDIRHQIPNIAATNGHEEDRRDPRKRLMSLISSMAAMPHSVMSGGNAGKMNLHSL